MQQLKPSFLVVSNLHASLNESMKEKKIAEVAQKCYQECPTIILGSGASAPYGLPSMGELATYLSNKLTPENDEKDAWRNLKAAIEKGDHLEAVLETNNLPKTLLSKIVDLSWRCVNDKDKKLLETAAFQKDEFELGRLLSGMFNSTQTEIHIVTTNYDRVAEYACNSKGILFQTGFAPGYVQKWEGSDQVRFCQSTRVVKLWKVHGSLDWFRTSEGRIVGLPVFDLPSENHYTPLIVTPGLHKYASTHNEPFRTMISKTDSALRKASAFLCIGFGFRDWHIQPKIIERCQEGNVPIVVLAKELTDKAKDFLENKAGERFLGIEQDKCGSMVYSPEKPDGSHVAVADLWSLSGFNKFVL